jgi:hypothetical protein
MKRTYFVAPIPMWFCRYDFSDSPAALTIVLGNTQCHGITFYLRSTYVSFRRGLQALAKCFHVASFSLIASFGACARSCFVPRYRSVVWTDECPSSN